MWITDQGLNCLYLECYRSGFYGSRTIIFMRNYAGDEVTDYFQRESDAAGCLSLLVFPKDRKTSQIFRVVTPSMLNENLVLENK